MIVVALLVTLSSLATPLTRPTSEGIASPLSTPDFSVSCCFPNPVYNVGVLQGSTTSTWGYVTSLNGFSGTVNLTLNLPFASSVSPTSLALTPGATLNPDVKVSVPSTTPVGNYYGNLTGQSGSITHFQALTVQVEPGKPDYVVTTSSGSVINEQGSSTGIVVLVSSVFGFSTANNCPNTLGVLLVTPVVVPNVAFGPSVSLSLYCLTLTAGGTSSTVMTMSTTTDTPLGSYVMSVSVCYPTISIVTCNGANVTVIVIDPMGGGGGAGGGKVLTT